jgi:hypothetical protein
MSACDTVFVGNQEHGCTPLGVVAQHLGHAARPATAYQSLSHFMLQRPATEGKWSAARRTLFIAFALGCTVSFLASERLTLRLVASGTVYATLAPLVEIGVLSQLRNQRILFSRAADLFLMGHGPWILWVLGFSALWSFAPPIQAFVWTGARWTLYTLGLVAVWSGYIDFCFFRYVIRESPARAGRNLLLQRAISWSLGAMILGGGALWPETVRISRI